LQEFEDKKGRERRKIKQIDKERHKQVQAYEIVMPETKAEETQTKEK
jgi:hypothetical protein